MVRVGEKHSRKHRLVVRAGVLLLAAAGLLSFPATAAAGTFPGVNGRIIMTDITGPAYHFTSVKPDGTSQKTVLSDSVSKLDVEYSPDGTKIAYVQTVSSVQQVFTANADGSNPQQITTGTGHAYTPSWSPDGSKILYSLAVSATVRIVRMNADGSSQTQLTTTAIYYNPEYSPDGSKIIAVLDASDDEIVIMNADGSSITNLTNNSVDEREASWAPDGSKIAYSSEVSGHQEIFTMLPNGSSQTQLTSDGVGYHTPQYSPDGSKLAFIDTLAPSLTYVSNADGTSILEIPVGWAREISWQPLTLRPSSSTPNPSISLSGGKAVVNIASLYTDTYEGIDTTTVAVTSTPASGTTSVDGSTGIVTYTPRSTAAGSFWNSLARAVLPATYAAATDSFTYRVCSQASSSLCSTGTVSVSLLGAPRTGAGRPGLPSVAIWMLGLVSIAGMGLGMHQLHRRRG